MNRREMILSTLAATGVPLGGLSGTAAQAQDAAHPLTAAWEAWKAAYMAADGRVVDRLQQGASHSESQGYGLLLAATLGDAAAFDAIDDWTMSHLALRSDALLAWRWLPGRSEAVPDRNNASDGDLFYAWALVRAAQTLGRPDLIRRAARIGRDLIAACIRAHPDGSGRLVLTPAAAGFQREQGLIVNPSYLMPLAMQEVARATGLTQLRTCATDGMTIQTDLVVAGLLPDWIELRADGAVPVADMSVDNGYEALRAPLFLIWSGNTGHPAVQRQASAYREATIARGGTPTIMERGTGRVMELSPDPGYNAIASFVDCAVRPQAGALIPQFDAEQPYYPATLHLMTLLAQIETLPQCVPL